MKKERNARKDLLDLYLYMDLTEKSYRNKPTKAMVDRFNLIKDKYDKIYGDRYFAPYEWNEYYGLFKLKNGRIGIDPKRMESKLHQFSNNQLNVMNKRCTTYFHPRHISYLDYKVNNFVDVTKELKREFKEIYTPIIKKTIDDINKERKTYTPGDVSLFMQGIYEYDEACMSANMATLRRDMAINDKIADVYITLLSQFFHNMASRIEAVSVLIYSQINPKMKKWSRDKLYDNVNLKGVSSRDLPSFKYHDKLYLIWNFYKHNNIDTYNNLKEEYPDVLIEDDYIAGQPAKYYVKLNEKLITELLNGVEKYFIEWCEVNCDENYNEAQWNYDGYFKEIVADEIEMIRNPMGLEF